MRLALPTDDSVDAFGDRESRTPSANGKVVDGLGDSALSIALIGPDDAKRRPIAEALAGLQGSATREISSYPEIDDIPRLVEAQYDVIIVELDTDPEYSLEVIEHICSQSFSTVMVYSSAVFPEMLVRCMRAGAREFLTQPVTPSSIAEALIRASVRRPIARSKKALGKLFVFVGAKGGSGVTTVASNFALALAKESGQNTVLIDLNLPFGDAALELGLTAKYSTANALDNVDQLDSNFLSKLIVKHSSGLSLLAGPDKYVEVEPSSEAVEKLLRISRGDFDYVVVDAGSRYGAGLRSLFEDSSAIYLVVQLSISELRNANRLICNLFRSSESKLEVVLNRFAPNLMGLDDARIAKALTVQPKWKVPSDFASAREAQNSASPLAFDDSPISRVIRQMSRLACGLPAQPETKRRFGLFGS